MSPSSIDLPPSSSSLKRTGLREPLRLLVSVRDAEEALIAVAAGVAVIDVKEPARGTLGRADDDVLRQIAEAVPGKALLSFAAGEAVENSDSTSGGSAFQEAIPSGYAFFKYGPADLALCEDWQDILTQAWRSGSEGASPIAVAYVDFEAANAPRPEAIVELAIDSGCVGMLFDTYGKAPRLGLTALSEARLRACIARARAAGLLVSLAGSLGVNDVADVHRLDADLIAVRGAVCAGDRSGPVDRARIIALKEAIARVAGLVDDPDVEAIDACPDARARKGDRTNEGGGASGFDRA